MFVSEDIKYIGVNDRKVDLFEGQYKVHAGMAYNSYLILDEKVAVLDTVDRNFTGEWLEKLSAKAACSSNSFSVQPLAGLTWLTAKTPLVRVPVLSNTAMEVLASASR